MKFAKELTEWYLKNKRDLPWRATRDPYRIWLSEIILQQTRVAQGSPYYFRFLERYPDVFSLAAATEEEVLKLWQGLGYYSRARNLLSTARYVADELEGKFPDSREGLLRLRGVGDYTASAIASVCYREPAAAVDGNVFRVLARIFGIGIPINTPAGFKRFRTLAQDLIDPADPGNFNQALIEFGAEQCTPRRPSCGDCIFSDRCVAFNQGRVTELPVKLRTQKIRKRHFNYLVMVDSSRRTYLQQRKGKGIWQGLYEFPLVETKGDTQQEALVREEAFKRYLGKGPFDPVLFNEFPVVHKLTHQHIHTKFWICSCQDLPQPAVTPDELKKLPVPVLIENFIGNFDF